VSVKTALRSLLTCQFLRMRAVLLLACNRPAAALARFEHLLRFQPLDRHALASRAHIQARQGRFNEAVESLRLLTQIDPQEAAGWFNLGYALQQLGQHGEAGVAFRRALAIDPRMDRAWYGLALVLMDARLYQAAADALENTTALQPMAPHGWFMLAQVRQALEQPDEALKIALHLRRFEPKVAAQLERALRMGAGATSRHEDRDVQAASTPAARHAA
jgi:tetratricopeptide (TPR) repeat protein